MENGKKLILWEKAGNDFPKIGKAEIYETMLSWENVRLLSKD